MEWSSMMKRRRFKQTESLRDRLHAWAKRVRSEAETLPRDADRDTTVKKTRQANVTLHLEDWANSPGLQPPK
jgi:hypothetical protein